MPRISWARFEYGLVAGPADAAGAAGVSAGPELGAGRPAAANATAITNEPILINLPSIRQRPGLRAPPEKKARSAPVATAPLRGRTNRHGAALCRESAPHAPAWSGEGGVYRTDFRRVKVSWTHSRR